MKILLQSTLFYPSVGGIETVSQCLAEHYTALGHHCTVLTRSPNEQVEPFAFQIVRNPTLSIMLRLIKSHDIIHCNGASIELVFWAKIFGKPIVWTHQSYLLQAIDGLGWVDGEEAPLTPFESVKYHYQRTGLLFLLKSGLVLFLKRFASLFISKHIAITHWVAKRQALPNQVVIYNPFPIGRFSSIAESTHFEYDFFFLGRLVSEKGVATLLKAFACFIESNSNYSRKLLLIGDGAWRVKLEQLAISLGIATKVDFVGKQTGNSLLEYVSKGKIAIIPSEWEEPMGGVALEMLAAGKPVIVSKNGGLAECVGDAGLLFENGNHEALAKQMQYVFEDQSLQESLREKAKLQINKFDELVLTKEYIDLFKTLI